MSDRHVATYASCPGVLDISWPLSPRVRRAEQLAQTVRAVSTPDDRLHQLVAEAAATINSDVAQISITSTHQVSAVVETGISRVEPIELPEGLTLPFEDTICAVALRSDRPIVVADARDDSRVASLPSVVDGTVGSYLGCPIRMNDGAVVGVLCVVNREPRDWSEPDQVALGRLADAVAIELDLLTRNHAKNHPARTGMQV